MLIGGCYCGAIRYEVTGDPFNATNCHCSICRRTTGAPFVTWFSVRADEFRLVQGQPRQFSSSAHGVRCFCGRCGTLITFKHEDLDEIDVTVGSLDDPAQVPPNDNTRTNSRLNWIAPDGRRDYRESRSD